MTANRRKFQAFVGDRHIKLLEDNGILGVGRNSKCSEWLRDLIEERFGKIDTLSVKIEAFNEISSKIEAFKQEIEALNPKMYSLKKEIEILQKEKDEKDEKIKLSSIKSKLKQQLKTESSKIRELYDAKKLTEKQFWDVFDIKNNEEKLEEMKKLNEIYYINK